MQSMRFFKNNLRVKLLVYILHSIITTAVGAVLCGLFYRFLGRVYLHGTTPSYLLYIRVDKYNNLINTANPV